MIVQIQKEMGVFYIFVSENVLVVKQSREVTLEDLKGILESIVGE